MFVFEIKKKMKSIEFKCALITPMFMYGALDTPEFRAPSIKGLLRYWWRAINGHLSLEDKKDDTGKIIKGLRTIEGEIFGDTLKRSSVIIIVREQPENAIAPNILLPHKIGSSRPESFKEKTIVNIELKLIKPIEFNNEVFDFIDLKKLFILAVLLGGFGKRSRRGMGSMTIKEIKENQKEWVAYSMPQTLDNILTLLPPQYFFKNERGNRIESKFGKNEKYPFIKQIQVGRKQSSLTLKISDTTNKFHRLDPFKYGASLGKAIGGRFASPVYVSIIMDSSGNNYPIITTLNTVPERGEVNIPLQEEFKKAIL